MENKLKLAVGLIFLLLALVFGLIGFVMIADQDFHRLLICFAFSMFGLGLRALTYEKVPKEEIIESYSHYFVALIAVISSVFLGFYGTLAKLPGTFFYFLSFTLFTCMGFIVRTVLNGLIR